MKLVYNKINYLFLPMEKVKPNINTLFLPLLKENFNWNKQSKKRSLSDPVHISK